MSRTKGAAMVRVSSERLAVEYEGELVIFLIGMRINKWWKVHKWLPALLAMPKMIKELEADPSSGFLGYNGLMGTTIVQYWKSFDHLEAYARNQDKAHWPAWTDFNRRMKGSLGDVGIWHETYVISPGQFEAIYSGMPPFGLGKVGELVPASGNREAARQRMGS